MKTASAPSVTALNLTVEISRSVPCFADARSEIEIHLAQHAANLREDLNLPLELFLHVEVVHESQFSIPSVYRLHLNGLPCRTQWCPAWPSDFSTRDAAAIIATGMLANRERLVTAELTGMIALQWSVKQGEGQPWSREGFREFLKAFVRRNFSLKRGREFAQNSERGARTRAEAERCFEQALADLQIGPEIRVEACQPTDTTSTEQIFQSLRRDLARSLGVIVGDMQAAAGSGGQASGLDIRINDVRVPMGDRFNGQQLAIGSGQQAQQISQMIRSNAGSLITALSVQFMMNRLKKEASDLTQLAQGSFDPLTLTTILREVLDEQVSIHDLRTILENLSSLWEYHDTNRKPKVFCSRAPLGCVLVTEGKSLAELDASDYSTCARLGLRSIPLRYVRTVENKTVLPVLLIDSKIEHRLQLLSESPLLEDECHRFRIALFQALTSRPAEVILCGQANRRHVRNLIDMEFPTLAVLSSEEILPGTGEIQPVCTIAW